MEDMEVVGLDDVEYGIAGGGFIARFLSQRVSWVSVEQLLFSIKAKDEYENDKLNVPDEKQVTGFFIALSPKSPRG